MLPYLHAVAVFRVQVHWHVVFAGAGTVAVMCQAARREWTLSDDGADEARRAGGATRCVALCSVGE